MMNENYQPAPVLSIGELPSPGELAVNSEAHNSTQRSKKEKWASEKVTEYVAHIADKPQPHPTGRTPLPIERR